MVIVRERATAKASTGGIARFLKKEVRAGSAGRALYSPIYYRVRICYWRWTSRTKQRPPAMFNLDNDDIVGRYWTGLNAMISAFSYGEPFSKLLIGATVGEWLLDNGLVEEVLNPRWPSTKPCYRLTDLGHATIKRGRYARSRPKRPKLKMLEPRLKPMEPRIKPLKRK